MHSYGKLGVSVEYEWIPTATISKQMDTIKETYQGLWIGPGVPDSIDRVLSIIQFARENNAPLLETCGGFQYIIMEYARNKMMLENAGHEERDPHSNQLVISKLACSLVGQKGEVIVKKPSKISEIYQVENIIEQLCGRKRRLGTEVEAPLIRLPFGEIFGVSGLFVADNSMIPTMSAANPTLTTIALAIRTADHILQQRQD